MSEKSVGILKSWFETGKKPTEQQFHDLIDSFYNKTEILNVDNGVFVNGVRVVSSQKEGIKKLGNQFITALGGISGDYNKDAVVINNAMLAIQEKIDEIISKLEAHGLIES
jgi:hypothetical protein